jgi:N-glycosylase/DNA lyase
MKDIAMLLASYVRKRPAILARLAQFKKVWHQSDEKIFSELCYCIMTANGSAKAALKAQRLLERTGALTKGGKKEILKCLAGVRFRNNKTKYILQDRESLTEDGKIRIKRLLNGDELFVRAQVAKDHECFKGLSFKEASHFLRNIGKGDRLAILDRHILRNLKRYEVIDGIPKVLTPKKYLETENKMRAFSRSAGIPLAELDLLWWSEETGEIAK